MLYLIFMMTLENLFNFSLILILNPDYLELEFNEKF